MAPTLDGLRVACLTANEGVEQVELVEPRRALQEVDAVVTVVAPEPGTVHAFNHLDRGDTLPVDRPLNDVTVDDFDALLLPGGVANPDHLRTVPEAVSLVKAFVDAGKPIAVICHGPWTLVDAGVISGRTLTSWPSLQTDVRNAGGEWIDQDVVICDRGPNVLVSSRKPDDLPAFCEAMVDAFAAAARVAVSVAPAAGVLDGGLVDPPEPNEPG